MGGIGLSRHRSRPAPCAGINAGYVALAYDLAPAATADSAAWSFAALGNPQREEAVAGGGSRGPGRRLRPVVVEAPVRPVRVDLHRPDLRPAAARLRRRPTRRRGARLRDDQHRRCAGRRTAQRRGSGIGVVHLIERRMLCLRVVRRSSSTATSTSWVRADVRRVRPRLAVRIRRQECRRTGQQIFAHRAQNCSSSSSERRQRTGPSVARPPR